jgi:hypothetical protein
LKSSHPDVGDQRNVRPVDHPGRGHHRDRPAAHARLEAHQLTAIRSLVQNNRCSTGVSTTWTTAEAVRPIFQIARPTWAADQEAMWAHSVSVSPIWRARSASGAVSWRRQQLLTALSNTVDYGFFAER